MSTGEQAAWWRQLDAAYDVAAVVTLLEQSGLFSASAGLDLEKALREFAADCLDAIDSSGHYQDASALARRVARGEVGPEVLLPARLAASPGGPTAMGALGNYHVPGAAMTFAALGVLSDTARDAARNTAENAALYGAFAWLHDLPDSPMAGQSSWSGQTMWEPWCAFVKRHHEEEQAEIARAGRELAADLVARLKAQLRAGAWEAAARPASVRHALRPINTTNVVPFRTGDITMDSLNRYYLEQGKWFFPVNPEDDQPRD